jgi:hypothetical protein
MNVGRILRRAAILGVTGAAVGAGMLAVATPAHAATKSRCDQLWAFAETYLYIATQYTNPAQSDSFHNLGQTYIRMWLNDGCLAYEN